VSLKDRVEALFRADGRLAAAWPRYEDRAAQRGMAADVARVFEHGGVFFAEAPTGVGKSLAYLLPAVLAGLETGQRTVIATCTKSLQDQLFERDLPALLEVMGVSLPCARLKGKQNYLCPRALETLWSPGAEEVETLEQLKRWAASDPEGDLDRFPAADPETYRRLRPRVAADPVACTTLTCRRARECPWATARRRAGEARLLIVNHAVLALSGETEGLLPKFDLLVVDEAHRLEGVLLSQLERSVSRHRIEEALRLLGSGRATGAGGPRGLAARVRGLMLPLFQEAPRAEVAAEVDRMLERAAGARADIERFFHAAEPRGERDELYGSRQRYRSVGELLGSDLEPLEALLSRCQSFARSLGLLASRVAEIATRGDSGASASVEELAAELERGAAVWRALGEDLEHLAEAVDRNWVYWRTGRPPGPAAAADGGSGTGRGVELHGSPVSVGRHARRLVLDRARATVLTSATLSAGGDFRFVAERLGFEDRREDQVEVASYPSPFPLERQMKAFIQARASDDEARDIAEVVASLAEHTDRSQLVLFTAHERLRRVRDRLLDRLPADRLLLAQEWDGPASRVSERFRERRGAILLGVQNLWEGVDFPGEALEILVVAKLPFSVPDDPLVEARGERLRERGLDPFRDDSVPEAVLRFRQGVGRLIRRADDRGVLVVCDARLAKASYRRPFLDALPVTPRLVGDAQALAREAAEFLGEPRAWEALSEEQG
jgi:Rad3-related DNA helicase